MIFGPNYAGLYDAVYADQPPEGEVSGLLARWQEWRSGRPATALDVGCGTGRHARLLAARGVTVTGTDPSPSMLAVAAGRPGPAVEYLPPTDLDPARTFDLVYSLGHVLSYQADPTSPAAFLADLASRSTPDGLVIVDCWHLAGMVGEPPTVRSREFTAEDGIRVERTATPTVDWTQGLTEVRIDVRSEPPGRHECSEVHLMRAYTGFELRLLCSLVGLTVLGLRGARDSALPLADGDWHALLIAAPLSRRA